MNARLLMDGGDSVAAPAPDAIWHAVRQLLISPEFAKAPRMCHLLSFLVNKKLSGLEQDISEYTIGLEVFRRDARCYDTTLDPVVRVQIGRLRGRLAAYYAAAGKAGPVRITIPLGNYVPVLTQGAAPAPAATYPALQLAPLRDLSGDRGGQGFVAGLEEEIGCRLFHLFGSVMPQPQPQPDGAGCGTTLAGAGRVHRLEGSIRVEAAHARASMRLVDAGAGQLVWSAQFDSRNGLGIAAQEELAGAICAALQRHLAGHQGGMLSSCGSRRMRTSVTSL